jgi:hypothetical protein
MHLGAYHLGAKHRRVVFLNKLLVDHMPKRNAVDLCDCSMFRIETVRSPRRPHQRTPRERTAYHEATEHFGCRKCRVCFDLGTRPLRVFPEKLFTTGERIEATSNKSYRGKSRADSAYNTEFFRAIARPPDSWDQHKRAWHPYDAQPAD